MSQTALAHSDTRIDAARQLPTTQIVSLLGQAFAPAAELSIIVPTFNERDNVVDLITAVSESLSGIAWEIVFVDDNSPDGTASVVREIARTNPRVRCLHRFGRRGLASACVEGVMATAAPIVAVMDADGQHDEQALRTMYQTITTGDADVVVGSRYVTGGDVRDWDANRLAMSRLATRIANRITGTMLSDPMSGFFMMRRDAFLASVPKLSSIGFKILLDIVASSDRPLKVVDVPYRFRSRRHGESKLDATILWEFLVLLLDKSIGRFLPARWAGFALIGAGVALVHVGLLALLFKLLGTGFIVAQMAAALGAITMNFLLNNALTYRDQRLTGFRILYGWVAFNALCAIGAIADVDIASRMFASNAMWLADGLAGIAIGVSWNYAVSSMIAASKKPRLAFSSQD